MPFFQPINRYTRYLSSTMKSILKLIIPALILAGLNWSCKKDGDGTDQQSLLEILDDQGDLELFTEALRKSGLGNELTGTSYTVMAPRDSVFQHYISQSGATDVQTWLDLLGMEYAHLILNYHIIPGTGIGQNQLTTGFIATKARNKYGNPVSLYIQATSDVQLNSYADITKTSFAADGLVIHEISEVLYLPTVIDLISFDPEFSSLRQSLQKAGNNLMVQMRQENESFCLFAPTNQGYQDYIAASSNFNDLQGFLQYHSQEEMRDRMLYHMLTPVINSNVFIHEKRYFTKLNGQFITLSRDNNGGIGILDAFGNKADVVQTDIHALNGIVHSVDYVLRPL